MQYNEWLLNHQKKHHTILSKLKHKSRDAIIEYFDYENMKLHETDFCPLYKENKKCHDTPLLNCFFCACPNFRFDDEGMEVVAQKIIYSKCVVHSKEGKAFVYKNAIHQDCSNCLIPHSHEYAKKNFHKALEYGDKQNI